MTTARDRAVAPVDSVIAQIAARQHGAITHAQLNSAGLSRRAIQYRLRLGRLHRLQRGVHAVGHRPPSPQARAMAAVLACGPAAVLSHHSAGALWGLGPRWTGTLDVTVPGDRRPRGLRVHRSRTLTRDDVTRHYGIPVTTPARTLLDLAVVLDAPALTRAVNDARVAGLVTPAQIAELLGRARGRATAALQAIVQPGAGPTRSRLEDDFRAFAASHELPTPQVNQVVAGHEVDALWREAQLVVELDSRAHHDNPLAFEQDRDRDADLLAAGFAVIRLTPQRMTRAPEREAARLRAVLDRRSRTPGPAA